MLDTITKSRHGVLGRPSHTEEAGHAERARQATDKLLELLIQRHPSDPDWSKYSSGQIAKPTKTVLVPEPIQENPAPSDTASDGLALRLIAEPEVCGAPAEWLSMQDVIPTPTGRPRRSHPLKVEEIQRATAKHYGVTRHDINSSRRTANIVRPRQVAMYLSKILTLRSLPDVGRRFGNRDHTTVLHAVRKIAHLASTDQSIDATIKAICELLDVPDPRAIAADPSLGVADEAGGAQ